MSGEARRSLRDRATEAAEAAPKRGGAGGGVSMTAEQSKRGGTSHAKGGQLKLADLVGMDELREQLANEVREAIAQALSGLGGPVPRNEATEAAIEGVLGEAQAAPQAPVSLAQQARDAVAGARKLHPKGGEAAYRVAAADLLGRAGPFLAKHQAGGVGLFLLRRPYRTTLCRELLTGKPPKGFSSARNWGRGIEAEVAAGALRA